MSARAARRILAALCAAAALPGCGQAESRGSVMLAISTDMYVDKDLDRVDIIVQPETGPAQTIPVNLFPATAGLYLPGTFAIVEGSQPGEFVRVRIVARKGDARARVVREAALRIPRERTALLPMPIQWLCDGHVRQEAQQVRSNCPEAETCISGSCQSDLVEESLLATYRAEDVFGGGTATGGGSCFDTLICFEQSSTPPLDTESCILSTTPDGDLNVAVVLPPGSDGHCTEQSCWIPLDASPLTGWAPTDDGEAVQLPRALCTLVDAGNASVRVSRSCASKTPATPTCGEWTLVGTEPGDVVAPPPVTGAPLVLGTELGELSSTLAERVARGCASVAQQSPPADPSASELSALCQQAASVVLPSAPLTWFHLPPRCSPDADRQLACEASCGGCTPGTVLERCEAQSLLSACSATCDSRRCLGSSSTPSECAGACDGQLVGQCQGTCLGSCEGECSQLRPDGSCDGVCSGTCTGLCVGRGTGSCAGLCDGDPMLPPAPCSAGALCLGSCAGDRAEPACLSRLTQSPCAGDGCIGDCGAIGRVDLDCRPATSWLLPPESMEPTLVRTLEGVLADLISVRDAEGPPAIDEAARLVDRLTSAPATPVEVLTQAQAALERLTAIRSSASVLIDSLGPPRTGPMTGTVPPPDMLANDCETFQSPGSNGLIDDFEDGNEHMLPNDGRLGSWHIGQDGTGTLEQSEPPRPEAGGANGSNFALHLSGNGFTNWGANVYFELRPGSAPYDASFHRGIRFWARGRGLLRVILTQQNLAPAHPCSTCLPESGECGLFYSALVELSDEWSEHTLNWSAFEPPTAILTPLAPDQLMKIEFEAPAPDPVDFWLDDVAFTDTIY